MCSCHTKTWEHPAILLNIHAAAIPKHENTQLLNIYAAVIPKQEHPVNNWSSSRHTELLAVEVIDLSSVEFI